MPATTYGGKKRKETSMPKGKKDDTKTTAKKVGRKTSPKTVDKLRKEAPKKLSKKTAAASLGYANNCVAGPHSIPELARALRNDVDLIYQFVHENLSIDNNIAEQEMKRIAMGRKAWLFFGNDNGGENAEVLFSIIATCKKHKVDPYTYLTDVIEQLMRNPDCDLEQLLPHIWKTAGINASQLPQKSLRHDTVLVA
jgi:hypothetical protein